MALNDDGNNMIMPVSPMYSGGGNGGNNNGWGGDGWWIILLLLLVGNNGWGGGFGGGFGGAGNMTLGYDFPWLLNGQNGINNNVNDGFRDAQLHDSVTSVRDGVSNLATQLCGCCGDIQMGIAGVNQGVASAAAGLQNSLCQGFAGTTAAVTAAQNGITQQLYNNELASLNRSFAEQTANTQGFSAMQSQLAQCCCDNRLATNDLKYTIATENCADRYEAAQNTRDIIENCNRNNQAVLDKLCQLELDGYKRENDSLRSQLTNARFDASQAAQTATFQLGLNNEVDALYNRLSNCPVPSVPVYGRQPIFNCQNNNNNCGCGCGSF